MTKRDFIRILEQKGLLKVGLSFGVISLTLMAHKDIFDYWFSILPEKGARLAVFHTSEKFKVAERTVWRAIDSMREIHDNNFVKENIASDAK